MREVGVLGLMPLRWGEHWMGPTQFFTRLAEYFHVVWVNPPYSWRTYGRRQLWLKRRSSSEFLHYGPALTIYEPSIWFPDVGRPHVVGRMMDRRRLRPARKFLDDCGCKKIITYLWRPCSARSLDVINHDISCYHINDEYTFSPVERPLGEEEVGGTHFEGQSDLHSFSRAHGEEGPHQPEHIGGA